MNFNSTDAWVLIKDQGKATFKRKVFQFEEIKKDEVLVKPIYGCVEGNLSHAINLKPEDIFTSRNEEEIILGNGGVVQVDSIGSEVSNLKVGDYGIFFCNGEPDEFGYPKKITAFDKPNSMGVLAKKLKLHHSEIIKVPKDSNVTLQQWAAFSLKYVTAWSNFNIAYKCWQSQMPNVSPEDTYVFGWGGGVTFAELMLAKKLGCKCFLMTSKKERLDMLENYGITGVDRNVYCKSDEDFLTFVDRVTNGRGVSIFIDNIGQSVYKLTMKSLGRQGVIATSGWKTGNMLPLLRANECQMRHIHVHTHYASYEEGVEAIDFAIKHNWLPPLDGVEYTFNEVPKLLESYNAGEISSWFPIFQVNKRGEKND
ncbi:zinc-binding alcohol dehydrogenase family protein [Shouchella hunanensis]|uniref:Zinc-binding alcohol dehydrogenase family protein n=1 Tax=Shouchella hunanensis TaxID=766894 RepID=A0ABY7W3J8_9BACI|nr:zinc-binding alcohol dehydrogenase family protein [Shouchella hunanensis]WDF02038.1 zinc-binding alcohol dehydrogenase family protein [Shouchella hunanensis]